MVDYAQDATSDTKYSLERIEQTGIKPLYTYNCRVREALGKPYSFLRDTLFLSLRPRGGYSYSRHDSPFSTYLAHALPTTTPGRLQRLSQEPRASGVSTAPRVIIAWLIGYHGMSRQRFFD